MTLTTARSEGVSRISLDQPSVKRLVEQIRSRQGIVPFVGAGLSAPFGLPTWRRFLLNIASQANEGDAVGNLLTQGRYEEAAELLRDALAPLAFDDALMDSFGDGVIVEPTGIEAVSLLPRLASGPVVTTNFDRVLERAYIQTGKQFERIVWSATPDAVVQALQLDRPFLLKVHGDIEDNTTRVLTRAEYDANYGDLLGEQEAKKPLSRLLQRLLESRTVLFLGCSLQDDRIVAILKHAATRTGPFLHYALVPEPALADERRERARFLSERQIRPIWYPAGRHDLIVPFLEELLSLIGAPDAAPLMPLVPAKDFFSPLLQSAQGRLFHHDWALVGRVDVLQQLHAWVGQEAKPVGLLLGRGGVGKSKLLQAFAQEFSAHHPGISLRFALAHVPFEPENLLLTEGLNVVVIDDAHHREDLGILLQFARRHPGRVKLLLTSRPHRVDTLRARLNETRFDVREVADLGELSQLARTEVQELACQALGELCDRYASRLADATRDSPLVTVLGGQLLRERSVSLDLLERDDEFRRVLLDRFQDELAGNVGDVVEPPLIREVLALIAAVAPVSSSDERFLETAASFVNSSSGEVQAALDALEGAGVLLRRGRLLRITPDVLADHALHRTCFRPDGKPNRYAQRVFDAFRSLFPGQVLTNLAELDWRIHLSTGEDSALLDGIWASLESELRSASTRDRYSLFTLLEKVAYYQPDRVLSAVEFAIVNPALPDEIQEPQWPLDHDINDRELLPTLLRKIAYNLEYLPRCCDLLWELGQDDDRPLSPYPDHAMRVLTDLADYGGQKPPAFNNAVLEATERWLAMPDAHVHKHSPLDALAPLLVKVGRSDRFEGPRWIIQPFLIDPKTTSAIRKRALELILGCLSIADCKVTLRVLVHDQMR